MPHPKRIDRAAIVSAAIEVLDERGLDALSLRTIAARLGVRQPALYRHVDSKVDLLADVAAEVLDRWHTDRVPADQELWQDFLGRNARSLRRAMLSVRDGARLIATAGPRGPNLETAIAQVGLLERSGFVGPDAILAFIAVSRYTIGAALEQQTSRDGSSITFPTEQADKDALHLAEVAAGVAVLGPEHEFEVGLAALIRGLGHLLDNPTS